jgi:hypothetical protein
MQILKAKIERELGSLPAELQEIPDGEQSHSRPSSEPSSDSGGRPSEGSSERMEQSSSTPSLSLLPTTMQMTDTGPSGGGEEDDELMSRFESQQGGDGRSPRLGDNSSANSHSAGWLSASPTGTEGNRFHGSGDAGSSTSTSSGVDSKGWSRATSNNPADNEALQKEKKQLHIVLKAYERLVTTSIVFDTHILYL